MDVKGKVARRWEDIAAKKKSGTSLNLVQGVSRHLRDEQEAVQKRTFTKWINSHLAKRNPPLVVSDLFEDVKDGVMLLALLEVLSGHKLIKLVNINTTDVVDGRPSIVLGLIWTIILYFQIEELTSHLPALQPQSSSNSSVESSNSTETSSPPVKRKPRLSFQGGARRALLKWVQTTATKRLGLDVKDFGPSWRTGVAFHAVIFALQPHLVNMERVWRRPNRENLEEAFSLAERELGIPRLLDPEDVDVDKPDEKSIMTYVAQFLKHHPDRQETEIGRQQEEREQRKTLRELKAWADQLERDCAQAQRDGGSLALQYQLLDWHLQLDSGLPHPLGEVGVWLHQAEKILREELVPQQAHDETARAIHKKRLHDQEILRLLERHKQTLQLIHRDRCVNNVPIPMEQLQDMAERLNYISTSSHVHLSKLEFWESKYSMLAFLTLAESKLKSWIIKYGRLESMELLLQSYGSFVEGQQFFEKYESSHQALMNAAEHYIKADSSVEGGVKLFLREVSDQWRSLSVEVRSVRSMLEEVQCNWLRYNSCVASLQAWLEDAQGALRQPENTKREFFRNLPHWMDQHAAMNDAGNFLIETCDETVTRDIKHQLLLLNGRWRELFLKVKQYARLPETHNVRMHQDISSDIHEFLDISITKLSSPLQVSLLDVKAFMQDVEDIKHRLPGVEAQYKAAARSAQLLAKDPVHGSETKALSTAEAQLHQLKEKCPLILRECQALFPLLEELETQISAFYQTAEHAGHIITQQHNQEMCQELQTQQQTCKRCVCAMERSYLSVQRALCCAKSLHNFDMSLLQNRVTEIQTTAQALMQEALEWRQVAETNGNLMRRYEESRADLEKALRVGQACLKERGDPDELFRKHNEFFGRLDQHILSAYLKACDDLTDIISEEDQQSLRDTVRRLHKQWKDIQAEAPSHLLRLRVETERRLVMAILQECRVELKKEDKGLLTAGSERMIKEHRGFFRQKNPLSTCEKRLKTMEHFTQDLPENDIGHQMLEETRDHISEIRGLVERTHLRLQQHSDKWREWHARFSELSGWLLSQQMSQSGAEISSVQMQRQAVKAQGETLDWLKARLAVLKDISPESEVHTQGAALDKLSQQFSALLLSLSEDVPATVASEGNIKPGEDVNDEEVIQTQEHRRILNAENVTEAKQLLLIHQVTVSAWQEFDVEREAIWQFVCLVSPVLQRELIFSSLDNLKIEMKNVKELHEQGNMFAVRAESLVKKAADIKLGPQNQSLLQDQAQSTKERLQKTQASLRKIMSDQEMIHRWWQGFSHESEAFFSWVCDSKKELEAFSRTSANLDEQMHTVEMLKDDLEEKMGVFSRLETEFQTLIHFVTPNEAGRIKARLMQIGRYREEFKNSVEQREAELQSSLKNTKQFIQDLNEVEVFLKGLLEKLNVPVTSCTSASMTYKTLHEHMDMQSEVPSQESLLESLETRAESLYSSASEERIAELRDLHCNLEERWCSLSTNIPLRIQELQSHLSKIEQFSQVSLALTQWSENFLRHIQSTCKVSITDLQSADSKTKEDKMSLQTQRKALEALQPHLDALSTSLAPKDLQNLQTRKEDCLQLFSEAQSLVEHRDEALLKLKDFCETYNKARTSLQMFQDAVEGRGSWDDSKVKEINQELVDLGKELACLEVQAISLDIILNKAHFHLQGAEEERTSCRGLVDDVALSVQVLQRSIGTKQSEAEALVTMWSSFRGRKELLLGSLAKLEDRASIPWPTEASTHAFQQRLWLLKQLEEELQALQHSQLWLGERGEQLAHRDSELAGEAQRDVALVQSTWERIRAIIVEDHDLCTNLLELCREYQTLRTRISTVIERAHAITVAQSDPHNPEDVRRALSRLEAVRPELAATKEDLNKLIGSGKHLTGVLKKLPEESIQIENVTTEMDAVVDQWLDISEKMDAEISLYTRSLELWNDINKMANEIECWSAISASELSEGAASLLSTHDMEERLSEFKLELDNKEDELKTLQAKMTHLQELMKTQHIHTELEVMAADLRKQISHAAEVYEQTKGMYKDFNSQRQQLQDLISQISEQLKTSEDLLSEFSTSSDPENFVKIKTAVGEVMEGEERLARICEDGERLLLHLTKCGTGSIQEQLDSCQYALDSFVMECRQRIRTLEESANLLNGYETRVVELSDWLQQLEVRLKTDAPLWGESQSAAPDCSEELRKMEEIHRELQMRRASLERLCQSSLTITEGGSRSENGVAEELLSNHEALLQEARSRLRSLQEYQAFEEALKAVETWLKDVERKLDKLENTEGNKKEVEEKLERAQDILLMKGEGEVKLNMAAGKAELVIKSSGEVEQGVICSKLQEAEDAWAALLLRAMSCHSRLEWTVNQWDLFVESRAQLQRWLEGVGVEVKGPLEPQLGLREKRKQLERLRLLSSDVEDHQGALCYLEESAAELYKRTGDPVFKEEEMILLRAHFEDVKAAAEERVRLSEDVVIEHKQYMETIRELTDWLMVVGEELQQCSDPSGDSPALNQKLTEVRGVLEGLQTAEVMEEKLKAQLNELCGFSSDLGPQSDRVSALIKLHNSLSLRASRECQNKEKLLEQRFRSSLHDFRQWMVNANISTAKCFDSPHSIQDASVALQRIQEFKSDKEQGQTRLNAVLTYGEQLSSVMPADRVEAIRTKANAAKDDWKSLMDSLQRRETALQVLQSQMQDFEASVEPLQDWLNRTEISVQESSARLHDLPAKRLELSKLQTLLEEMRSRESELAELRGRAHGLWEGQGAGKSFVHRVCQLAACYLALSNLIKVCFESGRLPGVHVFYLKC
ncbi:nesprin-1-like protein [Labeo rohita]|uniref:Nesprin-1-like protein n=1 Tax=Labeo rohita TaxID=84645 RepID=A0A498N6L5_LABRO|nr:nesprin-1-like protein [Labeo rohita]